MTNSSGAFTDGQKWVETRWYGRIVHKNHRTIAVVLVAVLLLAGCAAGNGTYSAEDQAGFFSGIWHGWIAPFALIAHIFDGDVRIYETNNDGIWYDVGFYIAVISGFGSLSLRRTSSKQRRRESRSSDR